MNAYAETYLPDAMESLGAMLDYAVNGCGIALEDFYARFLASRVAEGFGNGLPKYVAGMSGLELAEAVLEETGGSESIPAVFIPGKPGCEYWCGWALAYLQWHTGWSFAYIQNHGLPVGDVAEMYHPLHEADISKFADIAIGRIREFEKGQANPVKRLRKALGITQEELARRCGITLRMIQAYEQGRQDLSKAEASTLLNLSRALCCKPEELI